MPPRRSTQVPAAPKQRRTHEWVLAKVPDQLRRQLDSWAASWIKQKFARGPRAARRRSRPFNYPIEVFSEWRGKAFYICAKYRAKNRHPEDDFVVRSARMTLKGFGRFDLAYFRHAERWFTVYRGLTAAECFEEIEGNEVFWPM
jgi:hypothetical protein